MVDVSPTPEITGVTTVDGEPVVYTRVATYTTEELASRLNGAISRTSPDGSVTVTVPCDEAGGELP